MNPASAFPCSSIIGEGERPSRVRFADLPPLTAALPPAGQLRAGESTLVETRTRASIQTSGCEIVSTMSPV